MLKLALAAVDPSSDTSTEPRREDRKGRETLLTHSKNITKALRSSSSLRALARLAIRFSPG
jgi:hypothetical protein